MSYELQSVDALIDGVKGTTGFLSAILSRKSGLFFLVIVLGLVVSKILFS